MTICISGGKKYFHDNGKTAERRRRKAAGLKQDTARTAGPPKGVMRYYFLFAVRTGFLFFVYIFIMGGRENGIICA